MRNNGNERRILVLGGTGKTGGRVTTRLRERGVPVLSVARSTTPRFDWEDRGTWDEVLAGVDAVYISYYPDLAVPGAAETVGALAEWAVAAGARRLVLLSGRGEEGARAAEEEVQAAGAEWTIVRCSWFSQNFSESFFLEPVLAGDIALPVGDAPEAFVDAEDIADVAVAALTEDGHHGEIYELSGPRLLTFADAAAEISAATGDTVRFRPVSADEYRAMLRENDLPEEFVELFTGILDGRNAHLVDGVRRALGRAPRDFRDFVKDAATHGVWNR